AGRRAQGDRGRGHGRADRGARAGAEEQEGRRGPRGRAVHQPGRSAGRSRRRAEGLQRLRAVRSRAAAPVAMIVLGVDPGSLRTGWGVIRRAGPKLTYVAAGTIETGRDEELPMRLRAIYEALSAVIDEHTPSAMAVEDIFHAKFAGSALKLGHARGVALL